MSKRNPPEGGAGEARAATPRASILMQFPDMEGNPVFFDPTLVTGLREVVDKSRGVWNTLVFVGVPGGTTQVFTVFERAQMVGDRINMYRRGYGPRLEAVTGINYFVQKATEGDTDAVLASDQDTLIRAAYSDAADLGPRGKDELS